MHAQWSGLCHNPYGNWLGGPSDVHSIVAAIPTLNLADAERRARASREPDEVVDNAVFLEPIEEEPPERGSAAEAELIARFWHDYSSRMPQDSHAVGEQWAAACLRYRSYHVRDAAHSLRNYLDWRRVFELDRLGTPLHSAMRDVLHSQCVRLTGARDRSGRPILHVFASLVPPSSCVEDVVRTVHWLAECAMRTWPECQLEGIAVLLDCTGTESAALTTRLLHLGQQVIHRLKYIPVGVAVLLGLNLGKRMEPAWVALADAMPPTTEVRAVCAQSSAECVGVLEPFISEAQLLPDHGGSFEFSHDDWCQRVDATMCDEEWPWPTERPTEER